MFKTRNKASRGLQIILITTSALFVLFFVLLLIFGAVGAHTNDPELNNGIGDMFKYHFKDIGGLFAFNFHNASNVVYFSLSGLLYFFIFIAILYLIVGILLIIKKKQRVVIPGLVASVLVVLIYIFIATGLPKYWAIINQRSPFENDSKLMGPTFLILIFGILYILAAYILYFYSLFIALKNANLEAQKNDKKFEQNEGEKQVENNDQNSNENAQEIPVLFEAINEEVLEEENAQKETDKNVVNEEKMEEENMSDKEDLKALLREVVRDIVRDEIARNNANQPKNDFNPNSGGSITGATFGGPLVVQYFNGGIQGVPATSTPVPEVKKEEPQPQPAAPNDEPAPVEEAPAEEPVEEPAPIVEEPAPIVEEAQEEPAPVEEAIAEAQPQPEEVVPAIEEPADEKKPIIRIPFTERMLNADKEMQDNYNELKNEILSYGVNSRVSNSGDTFRLHRKTYVKITIAGLSLKLYFALNPDDYKDSTLPIQNAGHKGIYEEIPLVFKVKSGLSMRRCKQLIQDVFDKNGFEQGEIAKVNWVEELKNAPSDDSDDD